MQNIKKTSRNILMKQINNRALGTGQGGYQTNFSSINTINTTILSNFSIEYSETLNGVSHIYKVKNPITNNTLTTAELVSILNRYNIAYEQPGGGSNWFITTNGGGFNGGAKTVEYDVVFSSVDEALKGVTTIKLQKCNQEVCDTGGFMVTIQNYPSPSRVKSITITSDQIPSVLVLYAPYLFNEPFPVASAGVDPKKLTSIRFV